MSAEITSSMAHYLGTLYRLDGRDRYVSTGAVAKEVGVSSAAAGRMFGRMKGRGLVERAPYKGVRLTRAGTREALGEIRAHRLSEAFLVRVMGYGWHESHDLADHLAEIGDWGFVDRMEEKAGFPTRCPHGEPIPTRELVMPVIDDRPLTELTVGERGRISRVRIRDEDKLVYLAGEGLVPQVAFEVAGRAPFDGPIRLQVDDHESVLGVEIAERLFVEVT